MTPHTKGHEAVSSVSDGMYGPKHGKDINMKHVKPIVTLQGHETYQSMNP